MLKSQKALVFIDNHDNQRGHGGGGSDILTFRTSTLYKMATAYMLAWPYGVTQIMSSYGWDQNIVNGKDTNDWVRILSYPVLPFSRQKFIYRLVSFNG
jgi:alpha-amylase